MEKDILINNFGWLSEDKICQLLEDILPMTAHWSRLETLYHRLCDGNDSENASEFRDQMKIERAFLQNYIAHRIRRFINEAQPSTLLTEAER